MRMYFNSEISGGAGGWKGGGGQLRNSAQGPPPAPLHPQKHARIVPPPPPGSVAAGRAIDSDSQLESTAVFTKSIEYRGKVSRRSPSLPRNTPPLKEIGADDKTRYKLQLLKPRIKHTQKRRFLYISPYIRPPNFDPFFFLTR